MGEVKWLENLLFLVMVVEYFILNVVVDYEFVLMDWLVVICDWVVVMFGDFSRLKRIEFIVDVDYVMDGDKMDMV